MDNSIAEILGQILFNRDRLYLGNKNRKRDKTRGRSSVAVCGLRDPKDGLKRVNFTTKTEEEVKTTKIVKCFDIGIGANKVGEKVKSISLPLRGRGFIDYRG